MIGDANGSVAILAREQNICALLTAVVVAVVSLGATPEQSVATCVNGMGVELDVVR